MKKLFVFYILFFVSLVTLLSLNSCSQLDKNAVVAPEVSGMHPSGWINPSSANFHGKYISANKLWNLSACKTCHGGDYKGGNTGISCLTCHTSADGPENCMTCHGNQDHINPPKSLNGDTLTSAYGVGMHMSHLFEGDLGALVPCAECHVEPNSFSDSNHIGPTPDGRAELTFGDLAKHQDGHGTIPNPSYDQNANTCANVYCHGKFYGGNQTNTPKWTDAGSVYCGTCHGDPNTGSPMPKLSNGTYAPPHTAFYEDRCFWCHGSVIDSTMTIFDPTKHINGEINFNVVGKPMRFK